MGNVRKKGTLFFNDHKLLLLEYQAKVALLRFKVIHNYKEDYTYFTKEGLKCISVALALPALRLAVCVRARKYFIRSSAIYYTLH